MRPVRRGLPLARSMQRLPGAPGMALGLIEVRVRACDPSLTPADAAAHLGAQQVPQARLEFLGQPRDALSAGLPRERPRLVDRLAQRAYAIECITLRVGAGPLSETDTMTPAGIPLTGARPVCAGTRR